MHRSVGGVERSAERIVDIALPRRLGEVMSDGTGARGSIRECLEYRSHLGMDVETASGAQLALDRPPRQLVIEAIDAE